MIVSGARSDVTRSLCIFRSRRKSESQSPHPSRKKDAARLGPEPIRGHPTSSRIYFNGVREELAAKGSWGAADSRSDLSQLARRLNRWRIKVQIASHPSEWRIFFPSTAERGL